MVLRQRGAGHAPVVIVGAAKEVLPLGELPGHRRGAMVGGELRRFARAGEVLLRIAQDVCPAQGLALFVIELRALDAASFGDRHERGQ